MKARRLVVVTRPADTRPVLALRPKGQRMWMYTETAEDIVERLLDGKPGDEWEMKWERMTPEQIEAMPEFEGW